MIIADGWKDYEVIDTSGGEKLERWGDFMLIRPDPQVIWNTPKSNKFWKSPNAHYHRSAKGGGSDGNCRLNRIPDGAFIIQGNCAGKIGGIYRTDGGNGKHCALFHRNDAARPLESPHDRGHHDSTFGKGITEDIISGVNPFDIEETFVVGHVGQMAGYLDPLFIKKGDGNSLQTAFICRKLVIGRIQKDMPLQSARLIQRRIIGNSSVGRQFEKIGVAVVHIQGGDPIRTRTVRGNSD